MVSLVWCLQLGGHPLFKRLAALREHKVFSKGREVAEDLRERWETSDSPLVNRIQVGARTSQLCLLSVTIVEGLGCPGWLAIHLFEVHVSQHCAYKAYVSAFVNDLCFLCELPDAFACPCDD